MDERLRKNAVFELATHFISSKPFDPKPEEIPWILDNLFSPMVLTIPEIQEISKRAAGAFVTLPPRLLMPPKAHIHTKVPLTSFSLAAWTRLLNKRRDTFKGIQLEKEPSGEEFAPLILNELLITIAINEKDGGLTERQISGLMARHEDDQCQARLRDIISSALFSHPEYIALTLDNFQYPGSNSSRALLTVLPKALNVIIDMFVPLNAGSFLEFKNHFFKNLLAKVVEAMQISGATPQPFLEFTSALMLTLHLPQDPLSEIYQSSVKNDPLFEDKLRAIFDCANRILQVGQLEEILELSLANTNEGIMPATFMIFVSNIKLPNVKPTPTMLFRSAQNRGLWQLLTRQNHLKFDTSKDDESLNKPF